eukprot:gene12299-25860_t
MSTCNTLETFGTSFENSIYTNLVEDKSRESLGRIPEPRQIHGAHFVQVMPEKVSRPYLVAVSEDCAKSIGINPKETSSKDFSDIFCGNKLAPGLDHPFATIYGCHCYGSWFGQLGDGRAMSLGEVRAMDGQNNTAQDFSYELQLKGCGRTPFSRGFDGRAVLRSSIREFLVSEAMHNLGVPTTRALSVVGTGDQVRRPWYAASSQSQSQSMDEMATKQSGAGSGSGSGTWGSDPMRNNVSRSFLRFSHLEIFSVRKDY